MSFGTTMVWMISTAVVLALMLGVGFPAMAGAIRRPTFHRRDKSAEAGTATPKVRHHGRFHVRHGH